MQMKKKGEDGRSDWLCGLRSVVVVSYEGGIIQTSEEEEKQQGTQKWMMTETDIKTFSWLFKTWLENCVIVSLVGWFSASWWRVWISDQLGKLLLWWLQMHDGLDWLTGAKVGWLSLWTATWLFVHSLFIFCLWWCGSSLPPANGGCRQTASKSLQATACSNTAQAATSTES